MASNGYTRQSLALIQPGQNMNAEPLNAEFDTIQSAFDNGTGHDHSGAVPGDGQKIPLTTSVVGILPLANGGLGVNAATTLTTLPQGLTITGVLTANGATVTNSTLTANGTATFPGTIIGATTFTSTINAAGGVSDNGNRVISKSNLFGVLFATPVDPTGTASAAGVMAGLNQTFTPSTTGRIAVIINGSMTTTLNGATPNGVQAQIRYGTGIVPANGQALTGTVRGNPAVYTNPSLTIVGEVPFSLSVIITGLTLATTYWIDLSETAIGGGNTANLKNITVNITEI